MASILVYLLNLFFLNVKKWPNMLQKSCGVHTVRFIKYVLPIFNIIKERFKLLASMSFGSNTLYVEEYCLPNFFSTIKRSS